ncbi:MAG: hypothetical protein LBD52_07955 [Prevotellaceae bacterium]|nr:hypothetical protein [Prevotellaceae bacterium]
MIFIIGIVNFAKAQGAWDGLILSQTQYEGTARFTAMGGAFAALGGDFMTLSINPAGIGVYRNSEFTFSLALNHGNTNADYLGNTVNDAYSKLSVNNLGIVFGGIRANEGLVSFNWGVGYNKLHTVTNRRTAAQGISQGSSRLAALANELTDASITYQQLDANNAFDNLNSRYWTHILAWQTMLLDHNPSGSDSEYLTTVENASDLSQSGPLQQAYYAEQAGYTGEYVLSMGGNVSNKFYFGATFGIQSIRNEYFNKYAETAVNPSDFNTAENPTLFNSFTHLSWLNTSGTGYNVKLGVILRPVAGLRWGAYFHSPTWIHFSDKFSEQINSSFSDGAQYNSSISHNTSEYKVVTPVKWGMGLAYTFGNYGLLSVEYEGADYSTLKMYGLENDYYVQWMDVDKDAQELFKVATNIRAGAEYRINQCSLRAGYSYYGSPVKDNDDFARHIIAAGAGYQWDGGFIDAVYSFSPGNKETFSLYTNSNELKNTNFAGKFIITLGFRF